MTETTKFVVKRTSHLIFPLVAGILGVVLVLVSTSRYGAGLSLDSTKYISVARNVMQGNGLIDWTGASLVTQPPLYPLLLALFGEDPLQYAHIINALLFGSIIFLSGVLFVKSLGPGILSVLGTIVVLTTRPVVEVSIWAWSEPLFILLVLTYFFVIYLYISESSYGLSLMLTLSALVAAACMTRYIGVVLIASGFLTIILLSRRPFRERGLHATLFALLASVPLVLWMLRNYNISGTVMAPRSPARYSLVENIALTPRGIIAWFLPEAWLSPGSWLLPDVIFDHQLEVAIACTILVVLLAVWLLREIKRTTTKAFVLSERARRWLTVSGIYVIVYLGFLIVSSSLVAYDTIGVRLLSPVYIPVVLVLFVVGWEYVGHVKTTRRGRFLKRTLVGFGTAAIVASVSLTAWQTADRIKNGAGGYSTTRWHESDTIQYLSTSPLDEDSPVYSNLPALVYSLTDLPAVVSPEVWITGRREPVESIDPSWPGPKSAILVWFYETVRNDLFELEQLEEHVTDISCVRLSDGRVCTIHRTNDVE